MVVLKKIRASTLMETLVATVLIVIVFMIASMILNTMFSNSIKNSTRTIEAQLSELQYLRLNDKIELPYQDTYKNWDVSIEKYQENNQAFVEYEATNRQTSKTITIREREAK